MIKSGFGKAFKQGQEFGKKRRLNKNVG